MRRLLRLNIFLVYSISLANFPKAVAQAVDVALPPSSQTAAAAGESMGVANFYGIMPTNIPIYTIQSGKLMHPVTLSYFSAGNRLEDEASWVGLGFSLQAGGVITRTVQGLPDEKTDGFFNGAPAESSVIGNNALLLSASQNQFDTHPDVFYYNFAGNSGKMLIDRDGQVYMIPKRNFKIVKDAALNFFTITTEDGTQYTFDVKEKCRITDAGYHASLTSDFNSSWYLSFVRSADQSSYLQFDYTAVPLVTTKTLFNSDVYYKTYNTALYDKTKTESKSYNVRYSTPFLSKISFSNGYMTFTTGPRSDNSSFLLDKIDIFYSGGTLFKTLDFSYFYFAYESSNSGDPSIYKLKLTQLQETSNGVSMNPYVFDYGPQITKVPYSNFKNATDHWGFYNGHNQSSRIPASIKYFVSPLGNVGNKDYALMEGADLNPELTAAQTFMLTKVTYPTGGITQYEYELNEFTAASPPPPHLVAFGPITISTSDPSTKNFTVPTGTSWHGAAAVAFVTSACGLIDESPCSESAPPAFLATCPYMQITGPSPQDWNCQYGNRKYEFYLKPGSYQLKVSTNLTKTFSLQLYYYAYEETPVRGGGLRILRVKTFKNSADTNPIIQRYTYTDASGATTGKLNADFGYDYEVDYIDNVDPFGEQLFPSQPGCWAKKYWVTRKRSTGTFVKNSENSIGYSMITELQGENGGNGKTEYYFYAADNYGTNNTSTITSWLRGHLQKKVVFKKIGSVYSKLQETDYDYDFDSYPDSKSHVVSGYSVGEITKEANGCNFMGTRPYYTVFDYTMKSDWYFVNRVTNINYDDSGNPISRITNITTDYTNLLPVKTETDFGEPSKKTITLINYPDNYADVDSFISDLKTYHVTNAPIEQITYTKKDLGSQQFEYKVISGQMTTYKRGNNMLPDYVGRVDGTYQLLVPGGNPIALSNFTFSNAPQGTLPDGTNSQNFNLVTSQYAQTSKVISTDQLYSNPTSITDMSGITTSMVWGYGGNFVVCKASNSSLASFSSFELSNESGGWSYSGTIITEDAVNKARTGKKYYSLSTGTVTTPFLDNTKKYRISYWAKGGSPTVSNTVSGNAETGFQDMNGWKFYYRIVSGTNFATLSGGSNVYLDEVTLTDPNAVVETSTFDPLKGRTSKGDANGQLTTYEYDNLGRLIVVKDMKGNIVRQYDYHMTVQN